MTAPSLKNQRVRLRFARDFARSFAAGVLQNLEVSFQADSGLTEAEMIEAQRELDRISTRIEASRTYRNPDRTELNSLG